MLAPEGTETSPVAKPDETFDAVRDLIFFA